MKDVEALEVVRRAFFRRVPAADVRVDGSKIVVRAFLLDGDAPEVEGVCVEVIRPDADWECLFDAERLLIGPLQFYFRRKQQTENRDELVERAFAAARMLERSEVIGKAIPRWLEKIVHDALENMDRPEDFDPYVLNGDTIRISHPRYGWVTSHEQGTRSLAIADLPGAYLPRSRETAFELLRAIADVGLPLHRDETPPGDYTCSYCYGNFESMEFDAHHGACYSCAGSKLGVIY